MVDLELNFSKNAFSNTDEGGDYEKSLPLSSLLSLLGHLTLFAGLAINTITSKIYIIWLGLAFMTASIVNILIHSSGFIVIMVVLGSLPYILSSIWLLVTSVKSYNQKKSITTEP